MHSGPTADAPPPAALTRRGLLRRALGSGASVLLLAACGPASSAPSTPTVGASPVATPAPAPNATSAPATQPARALTPVSVSMAQLSGSFLPNYVALDAGLYEQNGLAVSQAVAESTSSMASLLSGQITFAESGGPELVNAVGGGADLLAVACLVPVYPYRLEVAPTVKTAEDLRGTKVGITNFGSTIDIATRLCLTRLGLDPTNDVTLLPLASVSARTAALLSGQIAAGLSQPPDWLVLEAQGFHSLFDMAAAGLATAVVTVIAQRSFVNANRDVVQRYVDALVQALAKEKNDREFTIGEIQKLLKYDDPQGLASTYEYYSKEVHPQLPYPDVAQFEQAVKGAQNANARELKIDTVIDRSFVQSAADRGLHQA
jgi:ABC-type nitrate/sulfonate/bicarbonate transport system substrate-binding protein